MRTLSAEDILFYENELVEIVKEFIRSVAKVSASFIGNKVWDFYIDFSQEKFIDEIEEE